MWYFWSCCLFCIKPLQLASSSYFNFSSCAGCRVLPQHHQEKKVGESQVSRGKVYCALISTVFGVSEVVEKSQNHLLWGSERSLCWELHPSSLQPDHQRRGSIQRGHASTWHVVCVLAQYFTKTRVKGVVFNVIVFTLRKIYFFFLPYLSPESNISVKTIVPKAVYLCKK